MVFLDEIPKGPTGKLQRIGLAEKLGITASDQPQRNAEVEFIAPRTPTEQKLAEIWSEVLGVERVGINGDFFGLGGHSLAATQVISRLRGIFQIQVPLHILFELPTVTDLAGYIDMVQWLTESRPGKLRTVDDEREVRKL